MHSTVLPRNGAFIVLKGGREALGLDQGRSHKVWGEKQGAEACTSRSHVQVRSLLKVACSDGDDDGDNDGCYCLWATCCVQENPTVVATAQENVGMLGAQP